MRSRASVFLIVCALFAQACSTAPAAPPAATTAPAAPAATTAPAAPAPTTAAAPKPTTAPAAAPQPTTAPVAAAAGPITLNVWVRNYTLNMESPFLTAKAAFEAKHPNVTVNVVGAPYDEQYQKIILSKAGGVKPDVFQIDQIWVGEMAAKGLAANLDSFYAKWDQASDIPDSYLASSKWKGSQYAAWAYTDVRTFMWNKEVFKQAGLDPEVPPKTWDELISMAKQVQDKVPGVSAIGFPAAAQEGTADRWYPYLFMTGGQILDDAQTKAAFNSPQGVKALQLLVDLVNKHGVTSKAVLGQDADPVHEALLSGQYAMMLDDVGDGWVNSKLDAATYKEKIGSALPPICSDGCKPASAAGGWLLSVGADSPNKDLAFEFLSMAEATENITPFEVKNSRVPVRKSGLASSDPFKEDPYYSVVADAAKVVHFAPAVPQYPKIVEQLYTAIQKAVQGSASPKDALDAAAVEVDKLLAE
jgi:multiple sugar transport system substrate-binding protein